MLAEQLRGAGAPLVLPSHFILIALSGVYVAFGKVPWVAGLRYGIKPVVAGALTGVSPIFALFFIANSACWTLAGGLFTSQFELAALAGGV